MPKKKNASSLISELKRKTRRKCTSEELTSPVSIASNLQGLKLHCYHAIGLAHIGLGDPINDYE